MNIEKVVAVVKETDAIFFDDRLRTDVSKKGDCDFVTRADTGISDYLRHRLREEFPDVGFKSEEEKSFENCRSYWILDPIDGTTNFMRKMELCAVSLGLCSDGELVAGVIYIPYTKEIYHAEKGKGAFLNGERISCNDNESLSECLAAIELNAYFKNDCDSAMEHLRKLYLGCTDVRVFGCAAAALAYVASGKIDVFLGRYLKPWDFAAGYVIASEAGAVVSSIGEKADVEILNQHIIASGKKVSKQLVGLLES